MSDPILTKLKEHDGAFKKIDKHFEKIDKRFEKIDKRFEKIDKRFEKIESTQDRLIEKVVQLEGRVEHIEDTMATKADIRVLMDGQDKMIHILERMDQERTFTNHRLDRHEAEITKIKTHLQLA